MTPAPPDPSLPAKLREFHQRLPLAGDPPNALLSLPDDRILYLAAVLRDTPVPAPALSAEEWQEFLDHLRPHGVYPLMAYRLRAWPEECRPPAEVMAWLNRVFLFAAARAMPVYKEPQNQRSRTNSSTVRPASRMIARSVPRRIGSCIGITTRRCGSAACFIVAWLPFR